MPLWRFHQKGGAKRLLNSLTLFIHRCLIAGCVMTSSLHHHYFCCYSYEEALQALADSEAKKETSDRELKMVSQQCSHKCEDAINANVNFPPLIHNY